MKIAQRSDGIMIKYDKIFKMFEDRNMSMYAVRKNKLMNDATIRNLKNGGNLDCGTLNRLCNFFECQPSDLIEYIPDIEPVKVS